MSERRFIWIICWICFERKRLTQRRNAQTGGTLIMTKQERKNAMITFVCYPKCSTCQKAQKWLDAHQIAYELRNIKTDNPTAEELAAWHALSGLPLKKFFNTSGLLYRSLELKDKLPSMTEDEMLALLATDGMLVKRPILVGDEFVLVGFKEKEWAEKVCPEA